MDTIDEAFPIPPSLGENDVRTSAGESQTTTEDYDNQSHNTHHVINETEIKDASENASSDKPHVASKAPSTVTIAAIVVGAAGVLAAAIYRHFKRSRAISTAHASSSQNVSKNAIYIEHLHLATPSVPAVPDSPTTTPSQSRTLPLKNYTFAISDRIDVAKVQTRFGCTEWQHLQKPCTISAPIVDALLSNGAMGIAIVQSQPFGVSYRDMDSLLVDSSAKKILTGPLYRGTRTKNISFFSLDNPLSSQHIHGGGEYGAIHAVSNRHHNHCGGDERSDATFAVCVDELGTALIPAACCGVYAYRPTAGLVPTESIKSASSTLSTPCLASSNPASLLRVATALGVPGSSSTQSGISQISQYLIAQDLFALCDDEVKTAAPAVVSAVRKWAGSDQAQALSLCQWIYYRIPSLLPFIHRATSHKKVSAAIHDKDGRYAGNGATKSTKDHATLGNGNDQEGSKARDGGEMDPETILDALYDVSTTIKLSELHHSTAGAWAANNLDSLPPETARVVKDSQRYSSNEMATHYTLAIRVAEELSDAMRAALQDGYVFVMPTIPGLPPKCDGSVSLDAMGMFHRRCVQFAALSSLAGVPQVTIPMPIRSNGLCIGISLVTLQRKDALLLHAASKMGPILARAVDEYQEKKTRARSLSTQQNEQDDAALRVLAAATRAKEDGNAAFKAGKYQDAVREYTKAIQLDQKNATYHSNRAMAYLKLGMYSMAERDCDVALEFDSTMVKALLRRGSARLAQGAMEAARGDFKAVLKLEPRNKQALDEISRLSENGNEGMLYA